MFKSDWRVTNPPPMPTISPNTSNPNFEIVILFNVVERSRNFIFEDDIPLTTFRTKIVWYVLRQYKVYVERVIV